MARFHFFSLVAHSRVVLNFRAAVFYRFLYHFHFYSFRFLLFRRPVSVVVRDMWEDLPHQLLGTQTFIFILHPFFCHFTLKGGCGTTQKTHANIQTKEYQPRKGFLISPTYFFLLGKREISIAIAVCLCPPIPPPLLLGLALIVPQPQPMAPLS